MTREEELQIRTQLHELLDIVLDTNGLEERKRDITGAMPTLFFEYAGHVNALTIQIDRNGWQANIGSEKLFECYCYSPIPEAWIDRVREICKAALTDKTEAEVLARDIEEKQKEIKAQTESLTKMKRRLEELEAEGE